MDFDELLTDGLDEGRVALGQSIRALIGSASEPMLDALAKNGSRYVEEPLFYAYFSGHTTDVDLGQLAFGYLDPASRPRRTWVRTDRAGTVYLPGEGYYLTSLPDERLSMSWDPAAQAVRLWDGDSTVAAHHEPLDTIAGTTLELYRAEPPLLGELFVDEGASIVAVNVVDAAAAHRGDVERAIQLLGDIYPEFLHALQATTRSVLVFHGMNVPSFAAVQAQGIAFLSARPEDDEVFFVEDLAHQGGHVLFTVLTWDRDRYLAVNPETPLRTVTGREGETRTVYDAFHGLFTEASMSACFDRVMDRDLLNARQRHEVLGRFALIMRRFASDLGSLGRRELFTADGWRAVETFAGVFEEIRIRRRGDLAPLDVANQPYVFDYPTFAIRNPATTMQAAAAT